MAELPEVVAVTLPTIQELVEHALSVSSAEGCIVIAEERTEANLRWAGNELTTNGQMRSRSLTVISTVSSGGKDGDDDEPGVAAGVVTRAVTALADVDGLVAASEKAARASEPAEDAAPLVQPSAAGPGNAAGWDVPPALTTIEVFASFAPALGAAFTRAEAAGQLLYGFAEHVMTSTYLGSSTGLRLRHDQPTGRVELNGKSADLSRSAWVGQQTRDFSDIDVSQLTSEIDRRLGWAKNRIDLPAGRYETVLPPTAVADLLIYAYWTASARDAEEGRNVFAAGDGQTKLGQQLSPLPLTLRSDPDEPGLECAPFTIAQSSQAGMVSIFDNGAPTPPVEWLAEGVLRNLMRTRSWAARTGAEPRLPVDNLILEAGGTRSLEDMIAATQRGLLVTCLWYIREVDPQTLLLTGLTRDGVYLIEDGVVTGVVNNFRFNESPIDLLGRVSEVGRTERTLPREWNDYFSRTAMPALRIPDFNMSTVSQAS